MMLDADENISSSDGRVPVKEQSNVVDCEAAQSSARRPF
jgi:hypothetical protein